MTPYHWFAALVAVNVLDAGLTLYALKLGGTEGNPLLGALMRRVHPALALVIVKGAFIVAVGVMLAQIAPWLPWMTAFFCGGLRVECGADCACQMTTPGNTPLKAIRKEQQHDAPSSAP